MSEDHRSENSQKAKPGMPDSSMEEIIASISRIIDEDSRTPHPVQRSAAGSSEILELTDVIEADGSVRKLAGAPPSTTEPQPQPPALAGEEVVAAASGIPAEIIATPEPSRDPMLSPAASEAAVAAFSRLGMVPRDRRVEPGPSLGADRTLEQIVRDTLHPLLQAWLDQHLPAIVERLVREEIQRVVRDAGLR